MKAAFLKHLPKPEVHVITRKITKHSVRIFIILKSKPNVINHNILIDSFILPGLTYGLLCVKGLLKYADNKACLNIKLFLNPIRKIVLNPPLIRQ